jgi:16S rRNA (adenine1518-N6/adenine1519-N6)-dimethyltransferase
MTAPSTLLRAWQIPPLKQLGQNFLAEPATAAMIVRRAEIGPEEFILEIGAGLGALTIPAARIAKTVVAIEKDRRLSDLFRAELLAAGITNVELIHQDILDLDLAAVAVRAGGTLTVMGNLPYNISSQILVKLIRHRRHLKRAVLMFQKELCQRLTASPGGRDYGRLTVMLAWCAEIREVAELRANQFHPRPRIDSQVIEIRFRDRPECSDVDEAGLFLLIKTAFGKRRKTLRNALLKSTLGLDADSTARVLAAAGIDPCRRAETLAVEDFIRLERAYRGGGA